MARHPITAVVMAILVVIAVAVGIVVATGNGGLTPSRAALAEMEPTVGTETSALARVGISLQGVGLPPHADALLIGILRPTADETSRLRRYTHMPITSAAEYLAAATTVLRSRIGPYVQVTFARPGVTTMTAKSGAGPRFHLVPRVTSTSQACEYTIGPLPEGSTSSITAAQAFAAFPFAAAELTGASATAAVEFAGVSDPAYGPVVNGKVKPYYSDTAEWVVIFTNVPTSFLNRGPSTHRMPTTGSLGSLVDPSSGLNNGLSSC